MEIKSYKLSATVPVGSYANIQPSIEIEGATIEEASAVAMGHIKELFSKHSDVSLQTKDVAEIVMLKSFNEGVMVEFDKTNHTYRHKGEPLMGATTFLKQFTKEFNGEQIAKALEKSWGVTAQEVLGLWSDNNSLATDFGTVVHKALENYVKNKPLGEKIVSKNGKENPALPKHPILRSICEGYDKVAGEGKVLSEILVTDVEAGRCGQVDNFLIVDEEKKVCRIRDYKVNIGSEETSQGAKLLPPYEKMPANKLSKYTLQLNFYAQMMEKSGWTVDGLDVFVLEDGWKHYELERVNI